MFIWFNKIKTWSNSHDAFIFRNISNTLLYFGLNNTFLLIQKANIEKHIILTQHNSHILLLLYTYNLLSFFIFLFFFAIFLCFNIFSFNQHIFILICQFSRLLYINSSVETHKSLPLFLTNSYVQKLVLGPEISRKKKIILLLNLKVMARH